MTKPAMPKPTAQVEPFVSVLGVDDAVDFLLTFGGADLEFPKNPGAKSELGSAIGVDRAKALGKKLNFARRRIPLAKPWLAAALKSKGLSNADISRKLHTTDVTVRKWLNVARAEWQPNPAQLSLFSDET